MLSLKGEDWPEAPATSQMVTGARVFDRWAWVELNYRPHAYQACALTT